MGRMSSPDVWKTYLAEKMKNPEFAEAFEEGKKELDFAIELALAREARKLTQRDLSEATGIRQPVISRYEKGQTPAVSALRKLAAALNASFVIQSDGAMRVTLNM